MPPQKTKWWEDHDAEVIAKFIDRITTGYGRLSIIDQREVHKIAIEEFGVPKERLQPQYTITIHNTPVSDPRDGFPGLGGSAAAAMVLRQRLDEGRRS